jgi:2-oxoisovalerate dehydrogenase E1 component beta subunit
VGKYSAYTKKGKLLKKASDMAEKDGIDCEVIDLQTLYPYDSETLF